jgi:hypothetical protein
MYALLMQNSTTESYCEDLVRQLAPDNYLAALFIPRDKRSGLLVLYALDAELRHVHAAVSEEITAHIRYAWWQESLDQIKSGDAPRAHPVVQSLAELVQRGVFSYDALAALVHHYRISYPRLPDEPTMLNDIAGAWVAAHCEAAAANWNKARELIAAHRKKHGAAKRWLLLLKLYWLGCF